MTEAWAGRVRCTSLPRRDDIDGEICEAYARTRRSKPVPSGALFHAAMPADHARTTVVDDRYVGLASRPVERLAVFASDAVQARKASE